ncbi:hypothetical protein [Aeromonas tecta]|uniref:hypothetical protein n=1 Tax=Aeromonas tecta TaxID=324617 RepID=UPI0006811704|nr:hypothetical protein [Aeromonas tecta]
MTNGELSIELTKLCGDACTANSYLQKLMAMRRYAAFATRANEHGAMALAAEAQRYEEELRAELYQLTQREQRATPCTVNTPHR